VTDWQLVCLVIIAVSVAIMAIIQVGLIVAGVMAARQLAAAIRDVRTEIRPLMDKVNRVADEAVRASTLAAAQVERVDRLLATTSARVDEVTAIVQNAMGGPIRQGAAAIMAARAVLSLFRQRRGRRVPGAPREDEDALFVG
jgi:hypothetical protein